MKYAKETTVSVEKTKAEIESILRRYGASEFMSGWWPDRAAIGFKLRNRTLRFMLPLPDRNGEEFRLTATKKYERSPGDIERAWEQACRQRWRALALAIKAKMEAVECGIAEFDQEFMAYVVLPSGMTVGETLAPQIEHAYSTGKLPPLLSGPAN